MLGIQFAYANMARTLWIGLKKIGSSREGTGSCLVCRSLESEPLTRWSTVIGGGKAEFTI